MMTCRARTLDLFCLLYKPMGCTTAMLYGAEKNKGHYGAFEASYHSSEGAEHFKLIIHMPCVWQKDYADLTDIKH